MEWVAGIAVFVVIGEALLIAYLEQRVRLLEDSYVRILASQSRLAEENIKRSSETAGITQSIARLFSGGQRKESRHGLS